MARPERRNVDYFPHYLSEGKKMYLIEHKYGNDGYAVWFKLLETLATTNDHWLNLNDETNVMFMSAKCRVSEDVLFNILEDLSKLGEISSLLWKDKVVWSDKFIESIQDAYSRRNNKCMQLDSLCQHLSSLGIHKPSNCTLKGSKKPQSKVEEIKVLYPSKEIALQKVDDAINYLRKVRIYRQYTESDDIFEHQVVLHLQLKEYLKNIPDWKIEPEIDQSTLLRLFTLINNWPLKAIVYLVDKFSKLFSNMRVKTNKLFSRIRYRTNKKPIIEKKKYKNF